MLRFLCALAFCLFATNAAAQSFNGQEQAEIRAIVRDYLVHNPDVLREALDAVQARANAERRVRIENDRRDFSVGPANAPITIVEFYDYRCPYCHAAAEWVYELTRTRRDIRIVLKELPILSPESVEAARAALAAMPQGRYLQFHRNLMGFRGELNSQRIDEIARQSGVDVTRMRRAMNDPRNAQAIDALLEENRGVAIDIAGAQGPATPLFMINGVTVSGFNEASLREELQAATRAAREGQRASR